MATADQDTNESKEAKQNDDQQNDKACLKWSKDFLANYDTFIFDCDGVVWLQNAPIPGAKQVLHELSTTLKKRVLYVSNNSTKDVSMYCTKFEKLFALKVESPQIFSSASATASYLNVLVPEIKQYLNNIKILLIGSQGLYNMLQNEITEKKMENVSIVWTRKDIANLDKMTVSDLAEMELDKDIAIVIAGLDLGYGYNDISLCARYLREQPHKMHLVGTNDDKTFPAKPGVLIAGTGSLLASIQAVSPIDMTICGKPHALLFDLMKQRYPDIDVKRCLMIGDRLETDIAFGINSGMTTAVVMTGITTDSLLEASEIKPTYRLETIADLMELKVKN